MYLNMYILIFIISLVCGTTGESSTMTDSERKETIKFAIDTIDGRIPVIAGTGSNCTASAHQI